MAQKDFRPYAAGYNGHAASCDCDKCAVARAKAAKKLAASVEPTTFDKTVYVREYTVRSHMRRNPNHLKKFPNTLKMVTKLLEDFQKNRSNSVY